MVGTLRVGTSGFAYKEWVGPFYPPGTPSARMLGHYSSALDAVEVNYTFRRRPTEALLSGWAAKVPGSFVFACRAPQGVTHFFRLQGAALGRLAEFMGALTPLAGRQGPVLLQTAPNLACDEAALDAFLAGLDPLVKAGGRFAFEFRHESFDTAAVRARVAAAGAAWCVADTAEHPAALEEGTAGFVYLRLRREGGYDRRRLGRWATQVREALHAGTDVYAFVRHDDAGTAPRDALLLRDLAVL